ncbi:hypothetical protein K470DRAFT_259480 [Piedraia hortae CBS 480.64]|uniref:Uncharacterized protein n=1 Tax=Piedraia hortae CBS 480.64 TaxID=1314780 RepID=A0A6A7BVM1_9PEZI|nr:hypothetical protein K470DRAFT_259480 [Piedraia hortae CBS 480.64]
MSIARAFTTRRKVDKIGGRAIDISQISSPVVLLSTSNLGLKETPQIAGTRTIEVRNFSTSSASSEESDASSASIHSHETVTDASSVDESPPVSVKPEMGPNHLSCYFSPKVDTVNKNGVPPPTAWSPAPDAPLLPARVPSHSKKAHETVHRMRAHRQQLASARPLDVSTPEEVVEAPSRSPFDRELAQLDEVAEEFGNVIRDAEYHVDMKAMQMHNLAQFQVVDYLAEIEILVADVFADELPDDMGGWI